MAKDPQPENGPEALQALAESVGELWFTGVCQLASVFPRGDCPNEAEQDLLKLFFGTCDIDKWLDPIPDDDDNGDEEEPPAAIKLLRIGPFSHFRRMNDALTFEPQGNVTLVFGVNGSGKTSLSLALRCLAKAGRPEQMLRNVNQPHAASAFRYKLAGDTDEYVWNDQAGFGVLSDSISYYDGHVAHALVRDATDPQSMVEIAPFGLEVFKVAGNLVKGLEEKCRAWGEKLSQLETAALKALRDVCEDMDFIAESSVQDDHDRLLQSLADDPPKWDEEKNAERIKDLWAQIKKKKKLLQPQRLEFLRRHRADFIAEYGRVTKVLRDLHKLVGIDEVSIVAKLETDRKLRSELLARILKEGQSENAFVEMLKSSEKVATLSREVGECPLCTQAVDGDIAERFEQYKEVLAATIQADIDNAEQELSRLSTIRDRLAERLNDFTLDVASEYLPDDKKQITEKVKAQLVEFIRVGEFQFQSTDGFEENVGLCARYRAWLRKSLADTLNLLEEIQEREGDIRNEIEEAETELRSLLKAKMVQDHAEEFKKLAEIRGKQKKLCEKSSAANWATKKRQLSTELSRINQRLVQSGFVDALNAEYLSITRNRSMQSFGVRVALSVAGQEVSATASVGTSDSRITEVLSEGEQRLHAIALFFAETKFRKPDVVVFDDPSVSFDYSYSDGVVERIIQHAVDHPDVQIIVFSHSWEFFVKMYSRLIKTKNIVDGFDHSAFELVNCSSLDTHITRINAREQALHQQINGMADPVGYTEAENASTQLRIFIEQLINKYVFANERQSFRTRPGASIAMNKFMEVKPLSQEQARRLDLVATQSSDWMHDNPDGGAAVVPSRDDFMGWYREVCAVKQQLHDERQAAKQAP